MLRLRTLLTRSLAPCGRARWPWLRAAAPSTRGDDADGEDQRRPGPGTTTKALHLFWPAAERPAEGRLAADRAGDQLRTELGAGPIHQFGGYQHRISARSTIRRRNLSRGGTVKPRPRRRTGAGIRWRRRTAAETAARNPRDGRLYRRPGFGRDRAVPADPQPGRDRADHTRQRLSRAHRRGAGRHVDASIPQNPAGITRTAGGRCCV